MSSSNQKLNQLNFKTKKISNNIFITQLISHYCWEDGYYRYIILPNKISLYIIFILTLHSKMFFLLFILLAY